MKKYKFKNLKEMFRKIPEGETVEAELTGPVRSNLKELEAKKKTIHA